MQEPLLLFDGQCGLCDASVSFVLRHDRDGVVKFAPLQSELGRRLTASLGIAPDRMDTLVLMDGGRAFVRSAASLRLLRYLGFPWSLLRVLGLVPRPLRDFVYDVIARHRYRWFGKSESCRVPSPEERRRFLDQA